MEKKTKKNPSINAPEEVDRYLASLPEDRRAPLERIRSIVKELVPQATERVSYGIPLFRLKRDFIGYAAMKNHYSLFIMHTAYDEQLKEELSKYEVSGTTIHFTDKKPITRELLEKIISIKLAETD